MREFLAEVHHRAWIATFVASALAAACALAHLELPAALAAGGILMWISEEENRLVAAMAPDPGPVPAPVSVPAAAAPPARAPAVRVREWASPFPASRLVRLQRQRAQGRRARRRHVAIAAPSD
jgi:hypothetical protein